MKSGEDHTELPTDEARRLPHQQQGRHQLATLIDRRAAKPLLPFLIGVSVKRALGGPAMITCRLAEFVENDPLGLASCSPVPRTQIC